MQKKILIIDDEESIQHMVAALISSHGMVPVNCINPEHALEKLKAHGADLVLLDIWMPEMDGHTVLKLIKQSFPLIPVIIFSGHAHLNTTIEIIKNGAADFIEKPFSGEVLLKKISKILKTDLSESFITDDACPMQALLRPAGVMQTTLGKSAVLTGKGLHTGAATGIILSPMPADSGIVFTDITTGKNIRAFAENVASANFATSLEAGDFSISCVEHLLAALNVFGIDNVLIKVNKEIPIMDGSAHELCALIEKCGIKELDQPRFHICIDKTYRFTDPQDSEVYIQAEPYDGLAVDYTLRLQGSGMAQNAAFDLSQNPAEVFKNEIAPARTFGFVSDLRQLQANGLGKGGDMGNFLMIDEARPVNTEFRFPDEPARHKVLDILGDITLLGAQFRGRITARYTGHRHNIGLIKNIISGII